MRKIHIIPITLILLALMAGTALAAGKNGTTLAAYKTLDICRVDHDTWRYSGVIAVWNEGAVDTQGFTINDFIEHKVGKKWVKAFDVFVNYQPREIPAGTTQETALTFPYRYDGAPLSGAIRNNAKLTILNHSGRLGQPFGPNPKATYSGPMPPPPCAPEGCVYTQGYWKNHPDDWPSGYHPDDAFFSSGKTWLGVLETPAGGNAYYILAHQYIAAVLNKANGASVPPGVQTTLDLATAWFNSYGPGDCASGGSCGLQKDWAKVLDLYNNGQYPGGPPHCD